MIWIKPNGQEIELNDMEATIEHAKSLGWKRKDSVKKTVKTAKKKAK